MHPDAKEKKDKPQKTHSVRRALNEMQTMPWFLLFILTFCAMSGRDLLFATAMGGLVENALNGDVSALRSYLYLLAGAAFISVPLQMLVAYLDGRFGIWGTRNLFRRMFPPLGRIPEAVFEKGNTADMQSRMTNDVNRVQTFVHSELSAIVWTSAYGLIPLLYLLYINPVLALICYGLIPLLYLGINKIMAPLSKITGDFSAAQADALLVAQESITQIESVKSYNLGPIMHARYREAQQRSLALLRKRTLRESISQGINSASYILPTFLMILVGVWMMTRGWITIAGLIIFIQVGSGGQWFIASLTEMLAQIRAANGHLERIYDAVDTPPERAGGASPDRDAETVLAFDNVTFAYEGRGEILRGLSFAVRRGETVALVGESGSGKSTAFKLIEGFYEPQEGSVTAFGRDIAKADLAKLRDLVAIVPQDPYFITGTIRDNLIFGKEGFTDDRLLNAMRVAGLGDLRAIWPDGLNTKVAEKGSNLSGGQKQRLAIARAVLRETPLLLFDEVTSALDYETEREVYRSIQSLANEHTILIISHRLSITQGADRIVVLNDGRVGEEGTHVELLASGGIYASLYQAENEGGMGNA